MNVGSVVNEGVSMRDVRAMSKCVRPREKREWGKRVRKMACHMSLTEWSRLACF